MTYIITYKVGTSDEIKLAQIEAESINEAIEKTNDIFNELKAVFRRMHYVLDVVPLNGIRKLDALE